MNYMEKLIHLLIPRMSNNHRAKILHTSSLFLVSAFLIVFQLAINKVPSLGGVLGFASNISKTDVVNLTNSQRIAAGLEPLTLNETLSSAAWSKGMDMINKDYWAHTAPDGTEPWAFFNSLGYRYRYAGENLARDFNNANSAIEAWMASPTHRDNILNPKYKEIGIGIVEGDLAGSDTTLIVQFFGTRYVDSVKPTVATVDNNSDVNVVNEQTTVTTVVTTEKVNDQVEDEKLAVTKVEDAPVATSTPLVEIERVNSDSNLVLSGSSPQVLISPFTTTKNTSVIIVSTLALVFLIDWFIVSRRRIARMTGKTFAHVAFLGMIFVVLLILKSGKII